MILESYKHFNAEEFIKGLKPLRKKKTYLIEELNSISELPAFSTSEVKTNAPSDLTGNIVVRREKILSEIAEIDLCLSAYDYAKSFLSQDEREVIELFFESKKPIWRAIEDYTEHNFTYRSNVYKARRKALEKIERIITNKYL